MSEPVFEAFARIRPVLDPSFRQDAQQQIQQAVDAAQAAVKVTPRQALLGTAQTAKELSLSKSVAETEALGAAFRKLEVAGVASQERIAAAAVEVRTALGQTGVAQAGTSFETLGKEGVDAQRQIQQAAEQTSQVILGTGEAAQQAAQQQIEAATSGRGPAGGFLQRSGLGDIQRDTAQVQRFGEEFDRLSSSISKASREEAILATQKGLSQLSPSAQGLAARSGIDALVASHAGLRIEEEKLVKQQDALAASSTRTGGSFARSIAGYTAYGVAVTAAFQASRHIQEALQATGREAFTTEGRFRNMGAALLNVDFIGAFQGLTAVPKTLDEAGISLVQVTSHLEAFERVAAGSQIDRTKEGYQDFQKAVDEAGTSSQKLAQEAVNLAGQFAASENAANSYADAVSRIGVAFDTANAAGQRFGAVRFGGPATSPDSAGGLQGPGAVNQINTNLQAQQAQPTFRNPRPIGPTARNRNAQVIASARGDLEELLRLRNDEVSRLTKAVANSHGNKQQRTALASDLASATADVISTQNAINDKAKADAANAKTAREAAAQAAATAAANARTATETNLQTEVAKAALTKRTTDDVRTTNALIEYLKKVRDNTDLEATVRADARKKIVAARANLQNVLKGEDGGADDQRRLKELQLSNAEAIAGLTKRKSDDRKAILASITYYRNLTTTLRKAGKDIDAETAKAARISAQGRLAALKTTTAATGGASTEDFFKAAVANFRQFGSNISQNPNGILSPQDARGAFAAIALADPLVTAVDRGTSEQRKQTLLLGSIAGALGVGAKPPARSPKAPTTAAEEALRHSIFLHGV